MMLVFILVLVILALVFGVGAVLEGLAWLLLVTLVLLAIAVWLVARTFNRLKDRIN